MKNFKIIQLFSLFVGLVLSLNSCVNDDDFDIPPTEEIQEFISLGGSAPVFNSCFLEDFESFSSSDAEFAQYENLTTIGIRTWAISEFDNNKYLNMSAFSSGEKNIAYFVIPVDFDAADVFSFQSQDRFNNGEVLKVFLTTDYTIEQDILLDATLTEITSSFNIAQGTTGSSTGPFVMSGDYDLTNVSGNGFIVFRYEGRDNGVTTSMHIDNIIIADTDNDDCTVNDPVIIGGGGSNAMPQDCDQEDFTTFDVNQDLFDEYENVSPEGERLWRVREFGGNKYIESSAFNGSAIQDQWFLYNVDFDTADSFFFKSKDGFNNGDPLTVLYSTDHTVGESVLESTWTDITGSFTIATGTSDGFAENFTESGTYDLSGISGNGFIAFRYQGGAGGITTTIQIDDVTVADNDNMDCPFGGGGDGSTSANVIISEIADPANNFDARFTELYNSGAEDVDLTGWKILFYANDGTTGNETELMGTISAGSTFVVASNEAEFMTVYGFAADMQGSVNSNGDDNFELVDGQGNVVDVFGVPGEDGTGTDHEFLDGRALRNDNITMNNASYTASEWTLTIGGVNAPDGFTPGMHPDSGGGGGSGDARINEFHYDNDGADMNEFVEVRITGDMSSQPTDLSQYRVVFYNGNDGNMYTDGDLDASSEVLSSAVQTCDSDNCYYVVERAIQNGAPDGLALVGPSGVIEFVSYEGTFTANDGPASGMMSTDVGVEEPGDAPAGSAIQRNQAGDVWSYTAGMNTKGAVNQ